MGKFRPLPEPIRLQDLLNSARSRTEKKIIGIMLPDVLLVKQNTLYQPNLLVNTSINIRPNDEHLVSRIKKPFSGGS